MKKMMMTMIDEGSCQKEQIGTVRFGTFEWETFEEMELKGKKMTDGLKTKPMHHVKGEIDFNQDVVHTMEHILSVFGSYVARSFDEITCMKAKIHATGEDTNYQYIKYEILGTMK